MKIKAFLFLLIANSSLFAYQTVDSDPQSEYRFYLKGGATAILPTVGAGFRYEKGHHGFDCSASIASIGIVNIYSGKLLYLNHPFSLSSQAHNFYIGAGAGICGGHAPHISGLGGGTSKFGFSLEQNIGYQWQGTVRTYFAQFEFSETMIEENLALIPAFSVGFGY